jgi:hypothetical protein
MFQLTCVEAALGICEAVKLFSAIYSKLIKLLVHKKGYR